MAAEEEEEEEEEKKEKKKKKKKKKRFREIYIKWWLLWRKKGSDMDPNDATGAQHKAPRSGRKRERRKNRRKESRRRRGEIEGAKRESVHILVLEEGAKRTTGGGGKAGEEVTRPGARPNDVGGAATVRGCRARPAVVREDDFSEEFN